MSDIIIDGSGRGNSLRVDNTNRAWVRSVSAPEFFEALEDGRGIRLTSAAITLTSANKSAVAVFTFNEDQDFVILGVEVTLFPSTGGTNDTAQIDATVGTTDLSMSGGSGNALTQSNGNLGSPKVFDITSESGAEAATIVGTAVPAFITAAQVGRTTFFRDINAIIPAGTSGCLEITPPAGNTSMTVIGVLQGYFKKDVLL